MNRISSSDRPRSFTVLLAAGGILLVVLALLGRNPVTHGLAVAYVAAFLGAVAAQAAQAGGSRDGKT